MSFLVLLVAILITTLWAPQVVAQPGAWFVRWLKWLAPCRSRLGTTLFFGAVLLVPVLSLALLLLLVDGWFFGLFGVAINLLVLLYVLSHSAVDSQVVKYRDLLVRGELQAAWHEAAGLDAGRTAGEADSWPDLHRRALQAVSYHYFERYFPVLLWFAVFGAPAALLYRLVSLAAACSEHDDAAGPRQLLWLLEWLPLRVLGLIFALVGNFATTAKTLRELFFVTKVPTAEALLALVQSTLLAEPQPSPRQGAEELGAVMALFRRALVLAMGLIALIELL